MAAQVAAAVAVMVKAAIKAAAALVKQTPAEVEVVVVEEVGVMLVVEVVAQVL